MGYVIAPRAETDLDDVWLYIAEESGGTEAADRTADQLSNAFLVLSRFPHLGRRRDEFGAGSRTYVVGDHVIVYCVQNGDVLILRVIHGRRDLDALFGDI